MAVLSITGNVILGRRFDKSDTIVTMSEFDNVNEQLDYSHRILLNLITQLTRKRVTLFEQYYLFVDTFTSFFCNCISEVVSKRVKQKRHFPRNSYTEVHI